MISKRMYKVLKKIPHSPATTDYQKMLNKTSFDKESLLVFLEEAKNHNYIDVVVLCPVNPFGALKQFDFFLTEDGQSAIDEYKSQKSSSRKATFALIISGLSFVASVVAIFVSFFNVQ